MTTYDIYTDHYNPNELARNIAKELGGTWKGGRRFELADHISPHDIREALRYLINDQDIGRKVRIEQVKE